MLLDAAEDLAIDLGQSVVIGDKASDLEADAAAGCARVIRIGPDIDGLSGSA